MKRWLSTSLSHHCFIFHFHILVPSLIVRFGSCGYRVYDPGRVGKIPSKKRKRWRRQFKEMHEGEVATFRTKSSLLSHFFFGLCHFVTLLIIYFVHFDSCEYWVIIKCMVDYAEKWGTVDLPWLWNKGNTGRRCIREVLLYTLSH